MVSRRGRGELESEVMAALWAAEGPMTASGVQTALGGGLAYNTVQTILIRLLEKGVVRRAPAGRGHIYWPLQDAAVAAAAVNPLLAPVREAVTYLVERWADEEAAEAVADRRLVARAVARAALATADT
jgi:predicted transcriptional regulator